MRHDNICLPSTNPSSKSPFYHRAHTRRCSGKNIVAFLYGKIAGQVADNGIKPKNHVTSVAILYHLAILF